jgi:hypothetical protein
VTNGARIYEITIRGAASKLVQVEFDDVQLRINHGCTHLRTGVVDQTVLFGLIRRIEDLGLVLLNVATVPTEASPASRAPDPAVDNRPGEMKESRDHGHHC